MSDSHTYHRLYVLLFIGCILASFQSVAQSPYTLRFKNELYFTGVGATTLGTGYYLRSRITLFTPEELERLDYRYVNELDREATQHLSAQSNTLSNYFLNASEMMPLLFLCGRDTRAHFGQIAALFGETMLINGGLTATIKYGVHRPRPFVYNNDASISNIQSINAQSSFVSGHTSTTAAASFFMARVYADFYPDSKWKPVVWTTAAVVPAVTGYLRYRAGKHYPSDIFGGYLLGAAVGYFVPQLHKARPIKNDNLTLSGYPGGVYCSLQF